MNRTVLLALVAAVVVSIVIDLGAGVSTPGLYSLVGLGGTAVIVVVTKQVGKRLLLRPEGSRVGDPRPVAGDDVDPTAADPELIDRPDLAGRPAGSEDDEDDETPHTAGPAGTDGLPRDWEDPTSAPQPRRRAPGGDGDG